jgi:hypothetical protein
MRCNWHHLQVEESHPAKRHPTSVMPDVFFDLFSAIAGKAR